MIYKSMKNEFMYHAIHKFVHIIVFMAVMEYDKRGLAITDRWIVRTEDVDEGDVDILGEFSSHKAAFDYIRERLLTEIGSDRGGYDEWVYGRYPDEYMDWFDNNTNDSVYRKEYCEEMRKDL